MNTRKIAQCALFAALMAVCAWISIPILDIAFTMQTFAIFLTLGLLGGKWGTLSILVYLLLGAVGLPVFSGFRGGAGALLGVTGGYIAGFLISGLVYWLITALWGTSRKVKLVAMAAVALVYYAFGSIWFYVLYLRGGNAMSMGAILMKCVVPYLLPDGIKLALAFSLTGRLEKFLK